MEKIRSIIIDDEPSSRAMLLRLLEENCPGIEVVAQADSPQSGSEAIERHRPDLVFLDVEMPSGSGFEVLQELHGTRFEVIFTTAHDQYALKAIKFCALDYLLKPIDGGELAEAVARVERKLESSLTRSDLQGLLRNLNHANGQSHTIALPTAEGLNVVQVSEIIRCQADGNYTRIHLTSGEELLVCRTLKEFDLFFSDMSFFRVHHSHLVNLHHVKKYVRGEGGHVIMRDNAMVLVAKRKKDEFMNRLAQL